MFESQKEKINFKKTLQSRLFRMNITENRNSKQTFTEILKILSPGLEDFVSDIVLSSTQLQKETVNMVEVVNLAYTTVTDWGTQCQILFSIATGNSLKTLPDIYSRAYKI